MKSALKSKIICWIIQIIPTFLYNGNYILDEIITNVSTLVVKPIINALLPFLYYFTFFFNHDNPKNEVINKLIYFLKRLIEYAYRVGQNKWGEGMRKLTSVFNLVCVQFAFFQVAFSLFVFEIVIIYAL